LKVELVICLWLDNRLGAVPLVKVGYQVLFKRCDLDEWQHQHKKELHEPGKTSDVVHPVVEGIARALDDLLVVTQFEVDHLSEGIRLWVDLLRCLV